MKECFLCKKEIAPGTPATSLVGGFLPVEEPDFFMVDEGVLKETYAHLPCLIGAVGQREASTQAGDKPC